MSVLRRFTTTVDGTIPIPALLYNDEYLLASQDNVGIYDGLQKASDHQSGTVHVSSHRLFFVNSHQPISQSFTLDLAHIMRTDYYAGLFMSSPKVTLYLDSAVVPLSGSQDGGNDGLESWICDVCNYRNPPGLSPAAARVCVLCGVPRNVLSSFPERKALASSASRHALSVSPAVALSTLSRSFTTPLPTSGLSPIACRACTFLNHSSLRNCEICSTPLPVAGNLGSSSQSAPSSRPESPPAEDDVSDPANPLVKLSFRKGGDRALYSVLRRALKARAWEGRQIGKGTRSGGSKLGVLSPDGGPASGRVRRSGIDGILHNVETFAQNTETELTDAFQDLEALMVKAQDLVQLAAELNEKLGTCGNSSTTNDASSPRTGNLSNSDSRNVSSSSLFATTTVVPSSEPEEAKFIRSSLAQLGLEMSNSPVTADMIRDERRWMEELARELAGVLQGRWDDGQEQKTGGIMKERGIIGLDEAWGGWNRARGVALIPPGTFLQTLQHLPSHTEPPVRRRGFKSGLQVLHTPPYTHTAFAARLSGYLAISGARTTSEIAREEGITDSLAAEMILATEADGVICRDEEESAIRGGGSGGEVRWTVYEFGDYIWDGQVGCAN